MRKKYILLAAFAVMGVSGAYTVGCAAVTDQHAVVKGLVVAEGLVRQSEAVRQGDVFINVKTLDGGTIAATRATTSGSVSQVLVKPGDMLAPHQLVAKISE